MKQIKYFLIFSVPFFFLAACNSVQNEAQNQADLIQQTMEENTPGAIATSENGYFMKAKIDGKEWVASRMVPDNDAKSSSKMVRGEKGEDNINFTLWKQGIVVGKIKSFSETSPAGIFIGDNPDLLTGKTGEVEITRLDEEWLEGRFHFTATSPRSDKKIEVTEGSFRVASGLK